MHIYPDSRSEPKNAGLQLEVLGLRGSRCRRNVEQIGILNGHRSWPPYIFFHEECSQLIGKLFEQRCGQSVILALLPFVLLVFSAAGSLWAVDPSRHISQYGHTSWRIQDGVFSGAPNAIAQTTDGYLWIGTENGLVRSDGVRFVAWTPPVGKFLSSGIFSLLSGTDGGLWIGTGTNLAHLKDGNLVNYTDAPGRINAIFKDRNGTVWLTRSRVHDEAGPLCQVVNTGLRCYGKADGITHPYAGPMIGDREGNLWIGSADVLTRWRTGSSTTIAPPGLKGIEGLSGVQALAVTQDDSIWAGISRRGPGLGLQHLSQGDWKPFVTPKLNGSTLEVTALFVDREDTLWVGTSDQGIYRVHDGKSDRFSSAEGLSSDSVSSFYEDREGNLWAATSEGVDCFRDISVTTFSAREGLSANFVDSVLAARDGTVWIGNHGALDSLRKDDLSSLQVKKGLPGERVTSLLEDHAGHLWVGVDSELYVYREGTFHRVKHSAGAPLGAIIAITEDRDNTIWAQAMGNPWKLVRIQDREVREEIPEPRVPGAYSLAADPKDGIWLGLTNGDLARYRHDQLETFPTGAKNSGIRQILVGTDDSVYGASSAGLIEWRSGTLRTLTTRNGLPCDRLYSLVFDSGNALWLYTQCGLVKVANRELQEWWDNPNTVVNTDTFDVFDGARPWGTAFQPRTSRSPDGRLWFANESVVQTIDPGHLNQNTIAPPVRVEEILADHKSYSTGTGIRLSPKTRDLEIDYTALSFVAPQKVRFRYKLEGHDRDWQEPGTRRQAFYNDLRPGHYRFRVIACNNDGVWNKEGASLDFTILPTFYQTSWFLLLCIAVAGSLVWLAFQWRIRQMAARIQGRMEERLDERERIARELHDTLLQGIQGVIMRFHGITERIPDSEPARQMMEKALDRADEVLIEGRDRVKSLRATAETVTDLREAFALVGDDLALSRGTAFSVVVEGNVRDLEAVVRDETYWIGREALVNAFHHGRGKKVEMEIAFDRKEFRLRCRDDGHGIDPSVLEAGGKSGHWGMRGMRERAQKIGAHLEIWSETGAGTEVELKIPGAIAYRNAANRSYFEPFFRAVRGGGGR
jgi:signal transduction histidine kinase/ligand-binding sensor domain-containing protein